MTPGAHTEAAFEATIESELLASGWHKWSDSYDIALGLDPTDLVRFVEETQPKTWARLSDSYGGPIEAQREFAKRVAREIDARGVLDVLRGGVKDRGLLIDLAYFRPGHTLAANAMDGYNANRLAVARQLHYSSRDPNKSLDLALFLNGIPIATAELKSPLTPQGWTVEDAKRQYREDRNPNELIFAKRTLAHFAVDLDEVFLTTRLAGPGTRFLPFNIGSNGPGVSGGAGNPPAPVGGYATSYLWREIWQRDNWLELLERYLHVEASVRPGRRQEPHKAPLIFPRYHQWHAVQSMIRHAQTHGSGGNYLIEHSAGSGKSNTIAWLAHRLSHLHTPGNTSVLELEALKFGLEANTLVFDKTIVITDRVVLDRQLQDTIYQFDHVPGVVKKIDEDSAQLAEALTGSTAKVIITTLQKFPYILSKVAQLQSKRYAIIIDEAHSSQSGESANALKKALGALAGHSGNDVEEDMDEDGDVLTAAALMRGKHPNLSYFAFTATPKAKTLLRFGTRDESAPTGYRPFHVYSMRQAIDEGFILDVLANYTTYQARWRLNNAALEAAERSEIANPEVEPGKARAALVRLAELHPTSQAQRAKLIVDHFRSDVAWRLGGRAKAMVVTRSREHALKLYQAISTYVESIGASDCAPLVAFSGTLTIKGEDTDYTETALNGFSEGALPEKFAYVRADDKDAAISNKTEYRILVVAEKYQTGFDQPLLTAMYVDKPLKSVAAVQTLSRLNRIHQHKSQEDVIVLDFANEAADIQKDFEPYFETTITEEQDPYLLYDKQREVMDFQLLVVSEMHAFAVALLEAEQSASPGTEAQVHAELVRFLQPALDRFRELAEADRTRAEEFRAALRGYVRAYALLAQVVDYGDKDLERLYQYGRILLNRLPKRPGPSVDIGETALSHFALHKVGQVNLSLAPVGDRSVPGFSAVGIGTMEVEQQLLSEVIEELNERFGLDLGTGDQILLGQQIVSLAEDDHLKQVALMQGEEKFNQVADDAIDSVIARNLENNTAFCERYFDDAEFQDVIKQTMRKRAFSLILDPARGDAMRRMREIQSSRTTEH